MAGELLGKGVWYRPRLFPAAVLVITTGGRYVSISATGGLETGRSIATGVS